MKSLVILLLLAAPAKPTIAASPSLDSHRVAWTSERVHRVLVTVAAAEIGEREMDDAPAALIFDAKRSIGARIDVRTIEVVRVDPATGQPLPGDGWTYAPQPEHRTFRWLDDAIPRDFPEVPGSLSRSDKPVVRLTANVGHTYAATGTWAQAGPSLRFSGFAVDPVCYFEDCNPRIPKIVNPAPSDPHVVSRPKAALRGLAASLCPALICFSPSGCVHELAVYGLPSTYICHQRRQCRSAGFGIRWMAWLKAGSTLEFRPLVVSYLRLVRPIFSDKLHFLTINL